MGGNGLTDFQQSDQMHDIYKALQNQ